MTTELGVMSGGDPNAGGARFTLSEDEEHGGGGRHGSGMGRQPTLNVHAAQQGVLVEQLPTPSTPAPMAPR